MRTPKLNKVVISGRLGRDPEVKEIGEGKKIASFNFVSDDGYWDKKSESYKESPNWHTAKGWGFVAEKIEKMHKGDFVLIEGRIDVETWEEDGKNRSKSVILIRSSADIQNLGGKDDSNQGTKSAPSTDSNPDPFVGDGDDDGLPF